MPTHDIPRGEWPRFFDELSRERQGAPVTITAVDPRHDPAKEVEALPLVGITLDEKGGLAGSIEIIAGAEAATQISHTIGDPVHVYHRYGEGADGAEESIEITARGEPPVTLIRFRSGVTGM